MVDQFLNDLCSAQAPQDFGLLDPDPQKYADPRIRIQRAKYEPKTVNLFLKAKSELFKKRDYKNFLISEWFIQKSIKISEK